MLRSLVVGLFLVLLPLPAAARIWRAPDPWPADLASRTRVLIIGDSNIYGPLGGVLQDALVDAGYVVYRNGKPSTGLSRQDRYDWFLHAQQMIDELDPQVVIAQFGGNDVLQVNWASMPGKHVSFKHEEAWRPIYRERVRSFLTLLAKNGRRVFFLSPTNRGQGASRVKRVHDEQRIAAAGVDHVTFIDMWPLTTDERGRWLYAVRDAAGKRVVVRRGDRIHLNDEGGQLIGHRVLAILKNDGLKIGAR